MPLIWTISMWFLIVILLFFLLYISALRGRVGFTDFKGFKETLFAHRGLFGKGVPENSLLAFKSALNDGYGAEFDVHLLKDGELAVIHDHSLLRTAGIDLRVEDLTLSEIQKFNLEGTDEIIPSFKQVLDVFNGKLPLIIELKASKDNISKLCEAVIEQLKDYNGLYCIESFDPRCIHYLKKNYPNVIRGQLAENYFKNPHSEMPFFIKLLMTLLLTNFINKPDFVAYRFEHRNCLSFRIATRLFKLQGFGWTIKTKEGIKIAKNENIIPIFEDRD